MMLRNSALAALGLVLLAPYLPAQEVHEFGGTHVTTPWPAGIGASGPFGRCVSARLTPDAIPDAVVLDGLEPVVLIDADPRFAPFELPLAALDLDRVRGAGPGGRDALAVVDAGGLRLVRFDPPSWSFVVDPIAAGAWAGARKVRAADLNGDGLDDLLGVAADGSTLLQLLAQGSPATFQSGGSAATAFEVRQMCTLQWNADPGLEVAVLSNWGIQVLEPEGTLLAQWPAVMPGGTMARLRQAGQATDRLAWITAWAPPAQQWLMTLAPGGAVNDLLDLGALDAFAAVGGDYDLDGDDDLLVSHHFSNELIWFENQRGSSNPLGPSFALLQQQMTLFRVGPPGAGATLNQAWPVVDDLDSDGDLDLLYAAETSMTLELLRGEEVAEQAFVPSPTSGTWQVTSPSAPGHLILSFAAPPTLHPQATHLEVDVWRRPSLSGAFEASGILHQELALPASWPLQLDLALPETGLGFPRIYAIELRQVQANAAGQVVRAFPPFCGYFAMDPPTVTALAGEPQTLTQMVVSAIMPASGPTEVGGICVRRIMGPPPLNSIPKPAP